MSIDAVCGLLAMTPVYYKLTGILVKEKEGYLCCETHDSDVIHLDRFFRWIEGQK